MIHIVQLEINDVVVNTCSIDIAGHLENVTLLIDRLNATPKDTRESRATRKAIEDELFETRCYIQEQCFKLVADQFPSEEAIDNGEIYVIVNLIELINPYWQKNGLVKYSSVTVSQWSVC